MATALLLLQSMIMVTMLMLAAVLAGTTGLSSSSPDLTSVVSQVGQGWREEWCPPCEFFFRKLKKNEDGTGKLSQNIRVQERGEPKSGTGMMYDWATGALDQTCNYLQRLYGEATCVLLFSVLFFLSGSKSWACIF